MQPAQTCTKNISEPVACPHEQMFEETLQIDNEDEELYRFLLAENSKRCVEQYLFEKQALKNMVDYEYQNSLALTADQIKSMYNL